MTQLNKYHHVVIVIICLFLFSACKEDKVKGITYEKLFGYWRSENIKRNYSVLKFTNDTLVCFEGIYYEDPKYSYKLLEDNCIIINAHNQNIKNKILYLDDSLLLLNSIFDDKEARLYRRFDFGKEKENLKYEDRVP